MDPQHRRRIREIQRRRGRNVNHTPEVCAAWQRCRELSLAYLDAVIAVHASGCPGAVEGWGKYGHLSPAEQVVRQDVDYADWVRHMEDTPWFPGRTLGHAELEALEAEIFSTWSGYAFQARINEEPCNCAGFDVERAQLYRAGASAVGFDDDDGLAQLTDGGMDLSGRQVEILPPPEAARMLGPDWTLRIGLPKIALRTWLIPDWEYPGYWLFKDNRAVTSAELADLLADRPAVSDEELRMLREGAFATPPAADGNGPLGP
jgi:hypothetical protein